MITVKHTSPNEITEIHNSELFGDVLFFSDDVYEMSAAETITYELDLDEDQIIEASSLFYRDDYELLNDVVSDVMDMADCDEDTAQELLSERMTPFQLDIDGEQAGEMSWALQKLMGQCATILGADAIEATDEQGCVYIVPMTDKLNRLRKAS